ncbi:DNA2/NAM7 helicase AAA [Gracilaria domingensis]|nr:DNA2/NAM7 helicase AAA [Gracilaria domingensis]
MMTLGARWKVSLFQLAIFRNPWQHVSRGLRFLSLPWCRGRRNQVQCLQTREHNTTSEFRSKPTRSPYDLVLFRRSRYVAHLNELAYRHGTSAPSRDESTALELALKSAGNAHEERVISFLENLLSTNAYRIPFAHPDRFTLTIDAIRRCEPIIAGAALRDDTFAGYADVLILSSLDPYMTDMQRANVDPGAYIVCEIKLSSLSTIDFILQTAAYASMLGSIHRELDIKDPNHAYLWLGSPENPPVRLEHRDLKYFFKRVKSDFLTFTRNFDESGPLPEPDAPLQMLSPWKTFAAETLTEADSLHLIAGIRQSQVQKISSVCGVSTLREFASIERNELNALVHQGKLSAAYVRLQEQARVQYESQTQGSISYRRIFEGGQCMPTRSDKDIFFDIEGYPLILNGLEYLFGACTRESGSFMSWWAHTRAEEEQAFIQLVTWIFRTVEEQKRNGNVQPHVFHYGHYEISALRRIALRAKTTYGMEAAVMLESLLENRVFMDVYKFIKSELLIGDPSYSIKSVEKIVGVGREKDDLSDAQSSVAMYHEWRMKNFSEDQCDANAVASHPILRDIFKYNEQDCKSLVLVVDWLTKEFQPRALDGLDTENESLHVSNEDEGEAQQSVILPGSCGRTISHREEDSRTIQRSEELSHLLIHDKSDVLSVTARQTLYHLLGFYVRESSPSRRAFRDRIEAAASGRFSELHGDDKCITGLSLLGKGDNGEDQRKIMLRYSFNKEQYTGLFEGESVAFVTPSSTPANPGTGKNPDPIHKFMTALSFERSKKESFCVVSLGSKYDEGYTPPKHGSIVSSDELKICNAPLRKSILRKAEKLFGGTDTKMSGSLSSAFLNRRRLDEDSEADSLGILYEKNRQSENIAAFLASRDRSGVFVIQGPPGSGKTSLSATIIHNLISEHNKTVAVSSNSHAAIDNLLRTVVRLGLDYSEVCKIGTKCTEDQSVPFKANLRDLQVKRVSEPLANGGDLASPKSSNSPRRSPRRQRKSAALVGATCYQLCREDSEGLFDFLFVDEASQVPVANFLAMSLSAKYAVLVGDQQQLEMPIKGAHPGESGKSCLAYMVGEGVTTVPPSRGLFLEQSFRMAPNLCKFVSDTFYDRALLPAPQCESNKLLLERTEDSYLSIGAGILYLNCDSEYERGAPSMGKLHHPAEVSAIAKLVDRLLGSEYIVHSKTRELRAQDILIVAPYNIQVRALRQSLSPDIRVGTVDKFQGQEAPIVIISLCTGNPYEMRDNVEEESLFSHSKYPASGSVEGYSSPMESRRKGLHFALQKNRLNVAISRAQCMAIVVGYSNPFANMSINHLDDVALMGLFEQLREEGHQADVKVLEPSNNRVHYVP